MDDGLEDEAFLTMVDAVEADVIKRRKMNNKNTSSIAVEEGKYIAALRGSNSNLWQQAYSNPKMNANNKRPQPEYGGASVSVGGNTGGVCYKCQQPGHWARDCVASTPIGGGGAVGVRFSSNPDEQVPEKQCPCGGGLCIVLTSNTEKNPGRKFYKCPVREESSRCGFFEWCDAAKSPLGGSGGQSRTFNTDMAKGSEPSMQCPCGSGPCSVLRAKTEKNMGRQFFKCPVKQGEGSCNFFKWCDEVNSISNTSTVPVQSFSSRYDNTHSNSERTGPSPCYKCGMDGHWAKNCPQSSSGTIGSSNTGQGDTLTCFKCGQAGHWANKCFNQASDSGYSGEFSNSSYGQGGIGRQGSSMYKSR